MIIKRGISEVKKEILNILGEVKRPGMDKLLNWLEESDYFTAPKSKSKTTPGGLAKHALDVYKIALDLYNMPWLKSKSSLAPRNFGKDSIAISALLHDVCKINREEYKNIQGHGEKSVYLIETFGGLKLTEAERNAIRYHMGPTNKHDPLTIPIEELKSIVRSSQLVGIIQTADNLSSIYSKDIN